MKINTDFSLVIARDYFHFDKFLAITEEAIARSE